jgi:fructokinase
VVVDIFPDRRIISGAPLFVAVHLAAYGWTTYMVTRVGDDADGRRVTELLSARNVNVSCVEVDAHHPTGSVTVDLAGTDHSFTIHGPAAWDFIEGPTSLPAHDVFCFGSLVGRRHGSLRSLRRLLENSAPFRALDVNLRRGNDVSAALEVGFHHATLLKAGGDEFRAISKASGLAPRTADWFRRHPQLDWIAITHGAAGAELHARDGGSWRVDGEDVPLVDTVGAGDAFFAGLVDALARSQEGGVALKAAQRAAIRIVGQRGGLPPRT